MAWYVVHTKAKSEHLAEAHLNNQDYKTFLPQLRLRKRLRGRWQDTIEAMFPGYLFIDLDLECDNIAPIRSTRGVVGLVRSGYTPQRLPDPVVQTLIHSVDHEAGVFDPLAELKKGDSVNIVDGPFAGIRGIFECRSGAERVVILLNLLGNENKVALPVDQVLPIG